MTVGRTKHALLFMMWYTVVEHPVVKEMLEGPRVATKFINSETSEEVFIDFE